MAVAEHALTARAEVKSRGPWGLAWQRLRRKKIAMISLAIILIIYGSGILAPWIAPYDYTAQDLNRTLQGPSTQHFFGTDRLGRDIFSRLIWGARTNAIVTLASIVSGSLFLGLFLGSLAGYLGRWVDNLIMRVGDIFLAFPGLLLVILIAATIKPRVIEFIRHIENVIHVKGLATSGVPDYLVVFGALAVFSWVGMARLIRGQILSLKETQYVEAARAGGASTWRVILTHLLPNAISPIVVSISFGMGAAAGSEVVLSWLGVGVQPPHASWGAMIFEVQSIRVLKTTPHLLLAPALTIGVLVFAFNLLGDGLNDALNPRAR